MEIAIGIILIISAIFLIIAVLMQQGKNHNLSGAIAGGADNFFKNSKGDSKDKLFSTLTAICSVIFAVLVVAMYIIVG